MAWSLRRAMLRGEILLYSTLPLKRKEVKITKRMLRLRDQYWPETKALFDGVMAKLGPGSICLDLGANAGVVTRELAQTGATVHAFEPDPHAFGVLTEAVGSLPNVILHNAAISGEDSTLTLNRHARFEEDPDAFTVGTSAFSSTLNETGGETFEVPAIGLEGFIKGLGRKVDLIKMDIEGSEVDVLERLLGSDVLDDIGAIFVETHEAQMPELRDRTHALRQNFERVKAPLISLDWH